MFVFNFRCTNSSGVPHSAEFERASQMVARVAKTTKDLSSSDRSYKNSSRDLQSLWEVPLFVRDDKAWEAVQFLSSLCAHD